MMREKFYFDDAENEDDIGGADNISDVDMDKENTDDLDADEDLETDTGKDDEDEEV